MKTDATKPTMTIAALAALSLENAEALAAVLGDAAIEATEAWQSRPYTSQQRMNEALMSASSARIAVSEIKRAQKLTAQWALEDAKGSA